jgi:hypothetical protein
MESERPSLLLLRGALPALPHPCCRCAGVCWRQDQRGHLLRLAQRPGAHPAPPHLDREGGVPAGGGRRAAVRDGAGGVLDGRGPAQGLPHRCAALGGGAWGHWVELGRGAGGAGPAQGLPHRFRLASRGALACQAHRRRRQPSTTRTHALSPPTLAGLGLHLESLRRKRPQELASGDGIEGNVIIDESSTVGANCRIGPNVAIGKGCTVGNGVRLANCVLLHRVKVKDYARVADSIVGWGTSGEEEERGRGKEGSAGCACSKLCGLVGACVFGSQRGAAPHRPGRRTLGVGAQGGACRGVPAVALRCALLHCAWGRGVWARPVWTPARSRSQQTTSPSCLPAPLPWWCAVGSWARVDNKSVIGEDVFIAVSPPAAPAVLLVRGAVFVRGPPFYWRGPPFFFGGARAAAARRSASGRRA